MSDLLDLVIVEKGIQSPSVRQAAPALCCCCSCSCSGGTVKK